MKAIILFFSGLVYLQPAASAAVTERDTVWHLDVEAGSVWQARNDVQIPGDTGTRYALKDVVGGGPQAFYRLELRYDLAERRQLRFLFAPLRLDGSGTLAEDVFFVDQGFSAGQNTQASYKFNSYRGSYRQLFLDTSSWRWWLGLTAKVRDAEIKLRQNNISASDANVGLVPLFNALGERQLSEKLGFVIDFDGLIGPGGRAFDLGLKLQYDISKQGYVGAGYRLLEGGADNEDVYAFAWLNYVFFNAGLVF